MNVLVRVMRASLNSGVMLPHCFTVLSVLDLVLYNILYGHGDSQPNLAAPILDAAMALSHNIRSLTSSIYRSATHFNLALHTIECLGQMTMFSRQHSGHIAAAHE